MKLIRTISLALPVLIVAGFAGAIGLSSPTRPPVIAAMGGLDKLLNPAEQQGLQPLRKLVARDGTALAYRFYEGKPGGGVAIMMHGSTALSHAVHYNAMALQAEGISTYVPDLRGHGESGPLGDIAYIGQLDDDLADYLKLIESEKPGEKRLLIGHSIGGGYTLRVAAGPMKDRFDGYIALSPLLGQGSPTGRPNTGGWASAAVPRIVALSIINGFGITAFNGLPVLEFAVEPDAKGKRAAIYSFRLLSNLSLSRNWREALGRIDKPALVMIGAKDELFVGPAYPEAVRSANPRIETVVLPDITHMGMTLTPSALTDVAHRATAMLGRVKTARP